MSSPIEKLDEVRSILASVPDDVVSRLRAEAEERAKGSDAPGQLHPVGASPPEPLGNSLGIDKLAEIAAKQIEKFDDYQTDMKEMLARQDIMREMPDLPAGSAHVPLWRVMQESERIKGEGKQGPTSGDDETWLTDEEIAAKKPKEEREDVADDADWIKSLPKVPRKDLLREWSDMLPKKPEYEAPTVGGGASETFRDAMQPGGEGIIGLLEKIADGILTLVEQGRTHAQSGMGPAPSPETGKQEVAFNLMDGSGQSGTIPSLGELTGMAGGRGGHTLWRRGMMPPVRTTDRWGFPQAPGESD